MKTVHIKGLDISALSLGTVQLGLNYGINNASEKLYNADGKPSQETANEILNCAMSSGINTLDTAGGYGDSEVVIGNWLKTVAPEKRPFIVTKAAGLDHSSLENLRKDLFGRVQTSKARLGVERLDLLMLHHFDDYLCDKDNVRRVMQELKAAGEVRFIGTSAYSHHDYGEIAATGFDATQIPLNLFDWKRSEKAGGLRHDDLCPQRVSAGSGVPETGDAGAPHGLCKRNTGEVPVPLRAVQSVSRSPGVELCPVPARCDQSGTGQRKAGAGNAECGADGAGREPDTGTDGTDPHSVSGYARTGFESCIVESGLTGGHRPYEMCRAFDCL